MPVPDVTPCVVVAVPGGAWLTARLARFDGSIGCRQVGGVVGVQQKWNCRALREVHLCQRQTCAVLPAALSAAPGWRASFTAGAESSASVPVGVGVGRLIGLKACVLEIDGLLRWPPCRR